MPKIVTFVLKYKSYVLLAGVIAYLGYARYQSDRAHKAELAAKEASFNAQASELNLVKSREVSAAALQREIADASAKNKALLAQLKKAGAKVTTHGSGTANVTGTDVGHVTTPSGQSAPTAWDDEYGRFHLDLKTWILQRKQRFLVDAIGVTGPDGETKFTGVSLKEVNPKTGDEIPGDGITFDWHVDVTKEAVAVSPWHRRLVAALGTPGWGAGVQFLNVNDRLNLSALGFYGTGDKSVTAGLAAAWRIKIPFIDSNLSVGPFYGYRLTPNPKWLLGAVATIELSR